MDMIKPNLCYAWQAETTGGDVLDQYNSDGTEYTWKSLNPDEIVRFSFIPALPLLPRHDVLIDHADGERFVKRFGRGFIRQGPDGFKLREYLNCCMTNRYRMYVFSGGRCTCTRPDYEMYL
jgi:hypothetical protein